MIVLSSFGYNCCTSRGFDLCVLLCRVVSCYISSAPSQKKGFEPQIETLLRHINTREFYSNNLRAIGPNHAQLYTSVEEETEQEKRQQNKTKNQSKVNK